MSSDLRQVLSANLGRLMGTGNDRMVLRAINGISASQLGRIKRGESAATVDALLEIARGLGCQPWELIQDARKSGLRFSASEGSVAYKTKAEISADTPEERKLLTHYRALQNKERDALLLVADAFVVRKKGGLGPYPFKKTAKAARKGPDRK